MGPRPFGRGEIRTWIFRGTYQTSLQWGRDLSAAESQVRDQGGGDGHQLQWGRDLSAAERTVTIKVKSGLLCFNGAATFRPRRAVPAVQRHGQRDASMGPRPFGRGEIQGRTGRSERSRFNGAATFRPRRGVPARAARPNGVPLQWGRDLSAAESGVIQDVGARPGGASMGPRPFGRGECTAGARGHAVAGASMGPRPFGRGEPKYLSAINRAAALQWGRDLSAAESLEISAGFCPYRLGFNGAATFRPRRAYWRLPLCAVSAASMGPRPFGRGENLGQAGHERS